MMLLRQLEPNERDHLCVRDHKDGSKAAMVTEFDVKHPITHQLDRRVIEYVCEHCAEDIFNQLIDIARSLRTNETKA